ncbi:winged helix-turn-helix transcriptional regulator [Nordella sp. HKS 07]|uniref:MarR family winged helix-turn-helix transcriptional regulator n=1 Tax=Nordella sp. HKS 07 TaxID=2712222 RepID=UPI0013E1EBCE|nr:MarR family winged helix-turn-helix transcriptional regulator [Nordella sp. HKS 07]QIG49583.1 winged helix-turn-helix transcriptional regulator [Nordella sp. HKS 07]
MRKHRQAPKKTLISDARWVARHCAGLNIRLAARQITRFLDRKLAETGLSLAQFGLLTHIASAADDTIGALAERSGLDQSTLSRNLRILEKAGLIEIAAVEADLRRRAVWLTERGALRLEEAMPAWREADQTLSEIITPQRIEELADKASAL